MRGPFHCKDALKAAGYRWSQARRAWWIEGDPERIANEAVWCNQFALWQSVRIASVISEEFRSRYLPNPDDPDAFEGRTFVFEGPEDYHARIEDPALCITDGDILVMRGAGPVGFPGAAEVVNMQPPAYPIRQGVLALPCIGDGRQSGTSGSPSILNASPEAAAGGNLALMWSGDRVRVDLRKRRVDALLSDEELADRRRTLDEQGGYRFPPSQTPWQAIQRAMVDQLGEGAILSGADRYQRVAETFGIPRDNH